MLGNHSHLALNLEHPTVVELTSENEGAQGRTGQPRRRWTWRDEWYTLKLQAQVVLEVQASDAEVTLTGAVSSFIDATCSLADRACGRAEV